MLVAALVGERDIARVGLTDPGRALEDETLESREVKPPYLSAREPPALGASGVLKGIEEEEPPVTER